MNQDLNRKAKLAEFYRLKRECKPIPESLLDWLSADHKRLIESDGNGPPWYGRELAQDLWDSLDPFHQLCVVWLLRGRSKKDASRQASPGFDLLPEKAQHEACLAIVLEAYGSSDGVRYPGDRLVKDKNGVVRVRYQAEGDIEKYGWSKAITLAVRRILRSRAPDCEQLVEIDPNTGYVPDAEARDSVPDFADDLLGSMFLQELIRRAEREHRLKPNQLKAVKKARLLGVDYGSGLSDDDRKRLSEAFTVFRAMSVESPI